MDEIILHRKLADALEENRELMAALQAETTSPPKSEGSSWFFWVSLTIGVAGLIFVAFLQGDLSI